MDDFYFLHILIQTRCHGGKKYEFNEKDKILYLIPIVNFGNGITNIGAKNLSLIVNFSKQMLHTINIKSSNDR